MINMEFSIYIKRDKEVSRKVIIAQKDNNDGYALILYQSNLEKSNNKFVAKYLPFSTINLENCKCYCNDIYGCLGLIYFRNGNYINFFLNNNNNFNDNNNHLNKLFKILIELIKYYF